MSLARNRSSPESRPSSQPQRRAAMEFAGHRGSSAGAAGLLVVPGPNYLDLDVDLDDEDDDVVIRIRPKSSPQPRRKTSLEEEDSDISEPPSLSGSRRVSFADAVGLSLVQIKEFDKWDVPQLPDFLDSISKDQEEYFMSPFNFTLSLSSKEIAAKVIDHKVELESIELLPGTTILKGVIRVLNISFTKAVYVRTSLDNWVSHFDLLSEYIPGSSEGQTDSFSFKLTLVPPFAEQGARVDFCLRYETPCGTFWANNSNRNFVLFCYKRKKEVQDKLQKENVKKSCLKPVSPSVSVEESMSSPEREDDAPDVTTPQKSNNDSQSNESTSSPAERSEEDGSPSQVENRRNRSRRNRRKAAKVARVRDYFGHKDLTTQDSETQPSPVTQTATPQEQNIEKRHSDCKGNIQLEDNADASLLNGSNSKQHEKLNPADAAISTDESGDLPNTSPTRHQNINKFVSSSSEERGPEAAGDCTRLSGERVDSEKLVSDSGGFAFGTVVAPLYHQVSCRVGGQPHSETRSSAFAKDHREAGGRSSSGEMNDRKNVGLYRDDEKVESMEQCRALMDIVEMPKDPKELENVDQINTNDSPLVETNSVSDPNPTNSLLDASEMILDPERELQDEMLSLDIQVTFAHEAAQADLFKSIIPHDKNMDDTVSITREQQSQCDIEKEPGQCNSLENNVVVVASSLSNTLIEAENIAQTSQNECQKRLESSCKELSLEFVVKNMEDSGKSQEDNVSLLLQPLQNYGFVDQFINITDNIKEPSSAKSDLFVSPNHVSKEFNDEYPPFTTEDLPNCSFLDPPSNPSPVVCSKTMTTSSSHARETAEYSNQSLLLEPILAKNVADESANTTSPDYDAGCVLPNLISTTSKEENPHLTSQLAEKDNSANHPNMSQVFDSQTMSASSTSASETPEEKSLLEQNEDLGKKSRRRSNKSAAKCQIQEMEERVEKSSTNSTNYVKEHDDLAGTVVLPTAASILYVENSPLSLQLSHDVKFTGPDELNADHNQKMEAISQNHALTESENGCKSNQLSQNEELVHQSKNTTDLNKLVLDHELSKTVALSSCDKSLSFTEENPYLPIQLLENQPPTSKDLVAHPYKIQEFTIETMAVLPMKESENVIAHIDLSAQEITVNSVAVLERDVATSCKGIVDEEIRPLVVLSNKSTTKQSARKKAKSKAKNYHCGTETTKYTTDNVIGVIPEDVQQCEMSQMSTMGMNLEDEPKKSKIMINKETEDLNDLILQTGNEEIIQEVQSNLVEDAMWQVSDTNIKLGRAEQLEKTKVLRIKTEEGAMNELEKAQEPTLRNEKCFDSPFETEMVALCPDDEENEGDRASGAMNEKELNESIASQMVGFDVDYKEEEKVKIHLETDEAERSEMLPCKVECNLSAPMDNVRVGIESSPEKITIETPDMPFEIDTTDFPHCSNDTKDWSESQAQGSTFTENLKHEQTGDNDNSNSDTDSGSEDEMELYMHCLRAVYGQQSSPKATRPEQNREKEFRRLSVSRGKRLSTSLPSISESLDEEQHCFKQEKEPERVEVQPAPPLLPDSSHKEEIDKYLWWKEMFSCRNILKATLYAIVVLVFLAVAYHYDFIACFGLYVISVIWLFFQGDRQTGKNNRVT